MGEIKHFFLKFFLLIWGIFLIYPARAELGQTPWYNLPFARVRMLSCLDGIQSQKMIVGGIQIDLEKGWTLQKPHLKSLNIKDLLWIDYPIRPNMQETKSYDNNLFIPMIGTPVLNSDFVFGVQGDLTACHEKSGCLTLPIQMQLPLSKESHHYTNYCAFIMENLKQVPLPAGNNIQATLYSIHDNEAILQLSGTAKMTQAFLQNDFDIPFYVLERSFNGDYITFRLSGKNLSQVKNWILITNQGVFRVPVRFEKMPPQPSKKSIPWWGFLTSGFMLFLCTPLFIFWGLAWPQKKNQFVIQSVQLAQWGTLILILFAGLVFVAPKSVLCFNFPYAKGISLILMFISLIFPPKKILLILLFFFVWPKPYLWDTVRALHGNLNGVCAWTVGLIAWLWLWCFFRVKGQKIWEKLIHQSLKKTPFATNLIFLMPTLFLCGWIVYQLNLPAVQFNKTGYPQSGLTVVCEGSDCLPWVSESQEPVHFISENSYLGRAYLRKYHRTYGPMVLWTGYGETTVLPEGITVKKFHSFKVDWQNYHVLGRQGSQPIHFGDALHVPSPNAK